MRTSGSPAQLATASAEAKDGARDSACDADIAIGVTHPAGHAAQTSAPVGQAHHGKGSFAVPASRSSPPTPRRTILAAAGAAAALGLAGATAPRPTRAAEALPVVRLGVLAFGTVQWVAGVIQDHGLDRAHGFTLRTNPLADNAGAKVALLGDAADIIVSDWLFVGTERQHGLALCFAVFSAATGAVVLGRNAPVPTLKDLAHRRLGVAGGPYDKSWMIVRAAARWQGIDLAQAADVVYAAPPLLNAKLEQGALDAALTYWNFAAALEVAGLLPLVTVSACAETLGLPAHPPLIGYVFKQAWAEQNRPLIDGFLAAAAAAEDLLVRSDAAWDAIRPRMHADDDHLFRRLRDGFRAGVVHPSPAAEAAAATRLFSILHELGGDAATGGLDRLPDGVFWAAPS
jgi:NitT/TauT family transport system substrate-binding protein